jgi:ubiquitin C-terminal hydrolase
MDNEDFTLINYWGHERKEELNDLEAKLMSLGLDNGQELLIDSSSPTSSSSSTSLSLESNSQKINNAEKLRSNFFQKELSTETNAGLLGLVNMGNTCFLNSAVQCLSHTYPLKKYFLSGRYEPEINVLNPIGSKGEMARTYFVLMQDLWKKTKYQALAPRGLMIQLAKVHSSFFLVFFFSFFFFLLLFQLTSHAL